VPPNVRELIEIALQKEPGLRYRTGGAFADAVAAVRSGRRPPRPNQSPTIGGRATPAAIPSATTQRPAANYGSRPAQPPARQRPATGSHRPPPPRRTFSSGQRALLWAAGVLGSLAIIIAIMLVLSAQDKKDENNQPRQTNTITTTTVVPGAPASEAPPASATPGAMPALDWTDPAAIGDSELNAGTPSVPAREQTSR
jgi:eukaryotic-like serine/threonine-protein kinase